MDHMDMTMDMGATSTATSAMSSSTSSSMSMSGMHNMGGSSCQISMLWNWYTIDACFLSKSWHITSRGMFAGSCIGVICLVLCLEFLRRVGREYDAFIMRRARLRRQFLSSSSAARPAVHENLDSAASSSQGDLVSTSKPTLTPTVPAGCMQPMPSENTTPVRPSVVEQLVRALLHMLQFAVAYFIMLLAMYFNGYIIICIFIGAFLGSFIFSWEPLAIGKENDATQVTKCCG